MPIFLENPVLSGMQRGTASSLATRDAMAKAIMQAMENANRERLETSRQNFAINNMANGYTASGNVDPNFKLLDGNQIWNNLLRAQSSEELMNKGDSSFAPQQTPYYKMMDGKYTAPPSLPPSKKPGYAPTVTRTGTPSDTPEFMKIKVK